MTYDAPRFRMWTPAILAGTLALAGCGGGGGGGGGGGAAAPAAVNLTGTAATGAAVANAAVVVKDRNGTVVNATSDANGSYTADVSGLTAPFLVRVTLPNATVLYSVAEQTGTCNITPLTDLIVETYYKVQNTTADAAFATLSAGTAVPTVTEVQVIETVVENVVANYLQSQGVDVNTFDLITTPFTANGTGADAVIAMVNVSTDGTTVGVTAPGADGQTGTADDITQNTTVAVDATTGTATATTTVTSPAGTSSSQTSTVIPTTSALQNAIDGVNAAMAQFMSTVNARGAALTGDDLLPFYSTDFLEDGLARTTVASRDAGFMAGSTLTGAAVSRVVSFDEANVTLEIIMKWSITHPNGATDQGEDEESSFFKKVGSSWLYAGNQRIARIDLDVMPQRRAGPISELHVNARVGAPQGTVSNVTVVGGPFAAATVVPWSHQNLEDGVLLDTYELNQAVNSLPVPGTVFTYTVTPVAGQPRTYTVKSGATTTEYISITNLSSTALAAANFGSATPVQWTLPGTFAIRNVELCGGTMSGQVMCDQDSQSLPITATSGQVTLQPTCNGGSATGAGIWLEVTGINGEKTRVDHFFNP